MRAATENDRENGASITPPSTEVAPGSMRIVYAPRLKSPKTRKPARPGVMYAFLTAGVKWMREIALSSSWQRSDRS